MAANKQLFSVLICFVVIFISSINAAFYSRVSASAPGGFGCTSSSTPADGCLNISGTTVFCWGFTNPGNKKIPTLARYDNGARTWCRGEGSNPYSNTGPDSTIKGAAYDDATSTLWIAGTVDGGGAWSGLTNGGFISSYGSGGGPVVSLVLTIDPANGNPVRGTYIRAQLTSGKTNSLFITGLSFSNNNNIIATADSAAYPPDTTGNKLNQNCVNYQGGIVWQGELNSDLSQLVTFCVGDYVGGTGCFANTCPIVASSGGGSDGSIGTTGGGNDGSNSNGGNTGSPAGRIEPFWV